MNEQQKNDLWQQFLNSGSVTDYLTYREVLTAKGNESETFHQRIDYSGTARGGERPFGNGTHP